MKNSSARGLKFSLLRTVIPLLLFYSVMVMAWSISLPWFGARSLGESWATDATRVAKAQLRGLQLEGEEKFKFIDNDSSDQALSDILSESETLVQIRYNNPVRVFPRSEWPRARFFREIHASGFFRIGDQLAYATKHSALHGTGRVVLLHYLDDRLADQIAEVTGNEVTIFAGSDISASSWRDTSGKRVFPTFDGPTNAFLHSDTLIEHPIPRAATYQVPSYRGAEPERRGFHRGQNSFNVFQWFLPIHGPERSFVGYISVAIPEDVVMATSKTALDGTVLLLALLCVLAIVLSIRYAERLVGPLTRVANELKGLAEQIHRRYSSVLPLEDPGPATSSNNEIAILESALRGFKNELNVAEKLSTQIEEERARTLAASKLAELGRVATGIMHEINTPLTVINCRTTELLGITKDCGDSRFAEVSRIVQSIEDSVMRISTIAGNVQIFARHSMHDDRAVTFLRALFDGVLEFYLERLKKIGIRFLLDWQAGDVQVHVQGVQIGQVIVNLLNNAKDAIEDRPDSWIEIRSWREEGFACFSVTDSGHGIAPSLKEKIMSPFFTTKPIGKGTGLGLSISKSIIESHHGRMELDDGCPNTRFVVSIPLHFLAEIQVSTSGAGETADNSRTFT